MPTDDERLVMFREMTLVLLDVAANIMAVQKLLYDAGVSDPARFDAALEWSREQLEVFRRPVEASNAQQLQAILAAMRKQDA